MAIVYTAKGSNESKAETASLSVNNVAMDAGTAILVGVIFFASANNPTIKWGNKTLKRDKTNEHSTAAFRTQLYRGRVKNAKTRDVVATWGTSTPGARAMVVIQLSEASTEDISVVNDNNNSTTPNTSSAGTSTVADTISIALFGSNGPSTDTAGTAGHGHTLGQRVGTSGGGDTTNLTIQETREVLSATGVIRGSLSGVTARNWANLIVAYNAIDTFTVASTYHRPWKVYSNSNLVVFKMNDGTSTHRFDVMLPLEAFEQMTDAQVTEYIKSGVMWYADVLDADNDLEQADASIETRLATFDNDTVTI